MMRLAITVALVALVGCADDKPARQRYVDPIGGYSVEYPDGWSRTMERGLTRFSPSSPTAKTTIVVRSAPKPAEIVEGKATTNDDVLASTERVLRSLPRASIAEREGVAGAKLPGARFAMTFVPQGLQTPYRRAHVTLVGKRRLFHVIFTAPASEPVDERALARVVSSLKEEV